MDAGERELFEGAVRRATESCSGDALDAALAELGWSDAIETDRPVAVATLFEAQGRANATSSALEQVLAAALGVPDPGAAALVLPRLRVFAAPARFQSGRCTVRGLGTPTLTRRERAIVVAARGGLDVGFDVFTVAPSVLDFRPISGLDPALGLVEIKGDLSVADIGTRVEVDWHAARAVGQLALAHELVGTARAMLELARVHSLERVQFGRPIASFQAVRHRLAEALVALEAAAALTTAAWDEPGAKTAALAKGMAGRSARTVARHAQQVLAGIGFTLEHPLHRYVRRTIVLDEWLGAGSLLTERTGREVRRTGTLPAHFPL
jgi:acyl-CoA dehydrogenase-like protein